MAWLIALVEDPKANIAGRYLCKANIDKDQLRGAIKEDWRVMNCYEPESLTISFNEEVSADDLAAIEGAEDNFIVWALEG